MNPLMGLMQWLPEPYAGLGRYQNFIFHENMDTQLSIHNLKDNSNKRQKRKNNFEI